MGMTQESTPVKRRQATAGLDESGASLRNFKHLKHATKEEFTLMGDEYAKKVVAADVMTNRFFEMLLHQKTFGPLGGPIDLFEHGLQTASKCHRAAESVDIVVMSLFHDITESISCKNHGKAAASLMEPYVSPKATWICENHEVFQGLYYFHHFGSDPSAAKKLFEIHKFYQDCADWCEKYDAAGFDRDYKSMDLEAFRPMAMEVFGREPYWWDEKHVMRAVVTGSGDA